MGPFLMMFLPVSEKLILTLGKANLKFGKRDINVLMAAIAFGD